MAFQMLFLNNALALRLCHSVIFLRSPSKTTCSLHAGKKLISHRSIKIAVQMMQTISVQSHHQKTNMRVRAQR